MRGGAHEPLTRADIEDKFMLNARHGGYDAARAKAALNIAAGMFKGRIDLSGVARVDDVPSPWSRSVASLEGRRPDAESGVARYEARYARRMTSRIRQNDTS